MEMERIRVLETQYAGIPKEIKELKRWVCYNKSDKIPMNALTGQKAASNNYLTWTTFELAIKGCVKYNFDGIGFMLGQGIFGVDLDNHKKDDGNFEMSQEEFSNLSNEFITGLNSYSEKSQSGNGIHIICRGKLPEGARRKGNIEMYDSGRYFAMTGNIVKDMPIENREEEIKTLWEKYLKTEIKKPERVGIVKHDNGSITFGNYIPNESYAFSMGLSLSDEEVISRIKGSKSGADFTRLYVNGDLSMNDDDHSSADLSLCTILAFWCGKDASQMDRIFRSSALMREKWDRKLGNSTYGNVTIDKAISNTIDVYTPPKEKVTLQIKPNKIETVTPNNIIANNNEQEANIDENGDPIIKNVTKSFKSYTLDDTGNAERFYDYFGKLFKYNADNQKYMFWDNKTWTSDSFGYAKKYADSLINILRQEADNFEKSLEGMNVDDETMKSYVKRLDAMRKNITRLANKAGKEAMLSELQHLHTIPTSNSQYNTQPYLLNTDSGIVDLTTGKIHPFDQKAMLSKNTGTKVSFDEPVMWLQFLHDIFQRPNKEETEEIIEAVQRALGDSLTGRQNKDLLFILYGEGSNGKSTFIQTVNNIFGDYGKTMNSALLLQNQNASAQSNEFAMSALFGARMVSTSETGEGKKLDEITIKQMTSGEEIAAQEKYGKPYSFKPTFSVWMSTNNKPIIRATDFGTWRRIFFIPFLHIFKDDEKDVTMPQKLMAEAPQILGWMIKGSVKLYNEGGVIKKPKCIEESLADYKNEMNVLSFYLTQRCQDFPNYRTSASDLYKDYKEWAKDNTEYLMSETKFGLEMKKRGYDKKRTRDGNFYVGIKLFSDKRGHIFGPEED